MKARVFFLALCMIMSIMLSGQNQGNNLLEVKVTPPKFTGIEDVLKFDNLSKSNSINQYVADNFIYPETIGYADEGTAVVQFRITPTGELSNFTFINSISNKIDEEIIRILKATEGMWRPGYNSGDAVAMEKEVTLRIKTGATERFALAHDFDHRAKIYYCKGTEYFFETGKLKKALRSFNNGIRYRPHDQSLYFMRGLCRYELGQIEGARQDWMRLKKLGGIDMIESYADYDIKDLKGYEELTTMFLENEK